MLCSRVSAVPSPDLEAAISGPMMPNPDAVADNIPKMMASRMDDDMSTSESKLWWWWWGDNNKYDSKEADELYKKKWQKYRHDNDGWGKPWWWWKKDW